MGFGYKYKPSKTKIREFAEKMDSIDQFCKENKISQSKNSDSYYFSINGKHYRVSNHTIAASNRGVYNYFGEQVREKYHSDEEMMILYISLLLRQE